MSSDGRLRPVAGFIALALSSAVHRRSIEMSSLHVRLTRALECAACRGPVLDPHELPPAEDCLVRCRACGVSFGLYCDLRSSVVRAIAEEIERKTPARAISLASASSQPSRRLPPGVQAMGRRQAS